jgi:uncharacterized membrane protein YfcA
MMRRDDSAPHRMNFPTLDPASWLLAIIGSIAMGISKAGFSGMSLVHVLIFAFIFGARTSTGIVLPMLIVADIFAVRAFPGHARWDYIRKMLPPAVVGIVGGFLLMGRINDEAFRQITGGIILTLAVLQATRMLRPQWFADEVPHSPIFAWAMGLFSGVMTMMANAAGPVFTIYALSVSLPKMQLVATTAWFFLIVNLLKVPLSAGLGLIDNRTLLLNASLVPAVLVGIGLGRWLTRRVSQEHFNAILLTFAALAALRLLGVW